MPDDDFPCCASGGPCRGRGHDDAEVVVIVPVCDLCHMPAVLGDDGHYRHADAANAVFCSLVMQRPR